MCIKIRKSVIQFTVLHEEKDDLSNYSLREILDECDTGGMIRSSSDVVRSKILFRKSTIRKELEAIGNDGTFFDEIDSDNW